MSLVDPVAVVQGAVPVLVEQGSGSVPALAGRVAGESAREGSSDPVVDAVVSVLVSLVVGGILLVFAPETSRSIVRESRRQPLYAGIVGCIGFFGGLVVFALIGLTIVGLVVSIPGVIAWVILALVGGTYGAMAAGSVVTDATDTGDLGAALVVGAVVLALVGLVPVVGPLVNFVVGMIGIGTALMFASGSRGSGDGSTRFGGDGSPPRNSEGDDAGSVHRGSDDRGSDGRGWK